MTRKSSFSKNVPPPALAGAVILTKRLLLAEKSSAGGIGGANSSSLQNLSSRAPRMTDTLRAFEGYSHHGINE